MYCDLKIGLSHEDQDVILVITELDYIPESPVGIFSPYEPESVEVQSGYVLSQEGCEEFYFDVVLEENLEEVTMIALDWYKEDDFDRRYNV